MFARRLGVTLSLVLSMVALGLQTSAVATDGPTVTFTSTGAEQQYVVPAGVWNLKVHAVGGSGECQFGAKIRDRGDDVTATISVTPGQVLYVEVGGNGAFQAGGYNGGGDGGGFATGGGGASDVRTTPAANAGSLGTRLVVAAGGAGGGEANSCDAWANGATVGGAGTSTSGGAGGTSDLCQAGVAGSLGAGGDGAPGFPSCYGGGGGGGGLYGGGGGGAGETAGAAGGRGSSGAPGGSAVTIVRDTTATPKVEVIPVLAPRAAVAPATVGFATQTLGTTSGTQVATVSNVGSEPLAISGLSFSGPQAGDFFTASSTCGAQVAPGASCGISVAFAPKGAGSRSASLVVSSGVGPLTFALAGTGVSNQFTFVKVTRNQTKGTAKVVVAIPGPGSLKLTGLGIKSQLKVVTGSKAGLPVVPKAKLRKSLEFAGEVRVKVKVTYTPTGGDARLKAKWVKLVLG